MHGDTSDFCSNFPNESEVVVFLPRFMALISKPNVPEVKIWHAGRFAHKNTEKKNSNCTRKCNDMLYFTMVITSDDNLIKHQLIEMEWV